jgi:hypothetical protein
VIVLAPSEDHIRSTYRWLAHAGHGVTEVRVIRPGRGGIAGIGFFDSEDSFVQACRGGNEVGNVYAGIQPRPSSLLSLASNRLAPLSKGGTKDQIEVVTATVIDIDPDRAKDTASTDAELALAVACAERVAAWAEEQGLVRPTIMMSGNGAQVWFAVPAIRLDGAEKRARVQAGLKRFEEEARRACGAAGVSIDSIHDLPRIIKVIGSVSKKGDPTPERPHRTSHPLGAFDRHEDARLADLVCAGGQEPPKPKRASLRVIAGGGEVRRAPGSASKDTPTGLCGPARNLWADGLEDRSKAVFLMAMFLAHHGWRPDDIVQQIKGWPAVASKLDGRDQDAYIRQALDRIVRDGDGAHVAPPCRAMQERGLCSVQVDPDQLCETWERSHGIAATVRAMSSPIDAATRDEQLLAVLGRLTRYDLALQEEMFKLVCEHSGLPADEVRTRLADARSAVGRTVEDAPLKLREGLTAYWKPPRKGDDDDEAVSNFVLEPRQRLLLDDGTYVYAADARTATGVVTDLKLPKHAFDSRRQLLANLHSYQLMWRGTDDDTQELLAILSRRRVVERKGVRALGLHRHQDDLLWVTPTGAFGHNGAYADAPLIYMPTGATLAQSVQTPPHNPAADREVLQNLLRHLPNLNSPEVVVPVLGWFCATPLKPILMKTLGAFPILFVCGSPGSGKSTLVGEVFWRMLGVRRDGFSLTMTQFALLHLLSSTTSIPVFLDEYKFNRRQAKYQDAIDRILRSIYKGESSDRGQADQTVRSYALNAPIIVCGEQMPQEAAILERLLLVHPAKTTLDDPGRKAAMAALRPLELERFCRPFVTFCLGRDVRADLEVAAHVIKLFIDGRRVPPRLEMNLQVVAFGVHLFEQFVQTHGLEVPELDVRSAVNGLMDSVLDAGENVRNAFDQFLEMVPVLAIQGELEHETHYVMNGDHLHLHLASAYDRYREHSRRGDHGGELLDIRSLQRMVKENHERGGYVVDPSRSTSFGEKRRARAVVIDVTKTDIIDADELRPLVRAAPRPPTWTERD